MPHVIRHAPRRRGRELLVATRLRARERFRRARAHYERRKRRYQAAAVGTGVALYLFRKPIARGLVRFRQLQTSARLVSRLRKLVGR